MKILTWMTMIPTLSLAFAGTADAKPDLSALVDTTCSYGQLVAAMYAEHPDTAAGFNETPVAQDMLRGFLLSPTSTRQGYADTIFVNPPVQRYFVVASQSAVSCHGY